MSETRKLNEPIASRRILSARLTKDNSDGNGPQGVAGAAGATIVVRAPGGNYATLTGTSLVEITGGGVPGDYDLVLPSTAFNVVGEWRVQVTNSSPAIDPASFAYTVDPLDCLYYGLVAGVPDNTHLDLNTSSSGGAAVGADGFYAKLSANRPALVRVVAGTGANQCRVATDYIGTGGLHRVTLAEAFTTALDTTSVIRIEALPDVTRMTSVLGTQGGISRTIQGVLRRMDWTLLGGALGILSSLAKVFQYDGATTGFQSVQDVNAGSRSTSTAVAGD